MGENGESDVDDLHKEAMKMYINYFEANAKHKVNVSQAIVDEIFTSKTFLSLEFNSHCCLNRLPFCPFFKTQREENSKPR